MNGPPAHIGAIDIGGTKIAIGLVTPQGQAVTRRSLRTADYASAAEGLQAIASALSDCLSEHPATLSGIGIGSTGPVDPIHGIIGKVANLPGWEGCQIVPELATRFGVSVAMENDADAAAMAEAAWGSGHGVDRFLYVTLSTGIGAGFLIDGDLYRGVNGSHPEMGHQTIDLSGPECYCGARGCWESLASGIALRDWYRSRDTHRRSRSQAFTAESIFELYDHGDPLAAQAIDRLSTYVGLGLANLATILVPRAIAIGGGLTRRADAFLDRAIAIVHATCREVPAAEIAIRTAALEGDVGLLGAAAVWLHAR